MTEATIFKLRERFRAINQKITDHPALEGEPRIIAAKQSCIYMMAITELVEVSECSYPIELAAVVAAAFSFCELIDGLCVDAQYPKEPEGYAHG